MSETNETPAQAELVIDEKNFGDYFFDVRLHGPQPGQVMATYTAAAEFCDGPEKRQIIEFLRYTDKVQAAIQVMRKALLAKEPDVYRIPRQMAEDLLNGVNVEEVAKKPYKFVCEACFWTKKEYIPQQDPHWACVSILNMDEHFAKTSALDNAITARIVKPEDHDEPNCCRREIETSEVAVSGEQP